MEFNCYINTVRGWPTLNAPTAVQRSRAMSESKRAVKARLQQRKQQQQQQQQQQSLPERGGADVARLERSARSASAAAEEGGATVAGFSAYVTAELARADEELSQLQLATTNGGSWGGRGTARAVCAEPMTLNSALIQSALRPSVLGPLTLSFGYVMDRSQSSSAHHI